MAHPNKTRPTRPITDRKPQQMRTVTADDAMPPTISRAQVEKLLHWRVAACSGTDQRDQACAQSEDRKRTLAIARAIMDGAPIEPWAIRPEIVVSASGLKYLRLRILMVPEEMSCDIPLGEPFGTADLPETPECARTAVELRAWCASEHEAQLSDADADRAMGRIWAAELRLVKERPRPVA